MTARRGKWKYNGERPKGSVIKSPYDLIFYYNLKNKNKEIKNKINTIWHLIKMCVWVNWN